MLIKDLDIAVKEAERFLAKARPLLSNAKAGVKSATSYINNVESLCFRDNKVTNKHNAAVKRSSLDLTRSLAEIRKSK